jgi:C4-type Zn-finger protein
VPIVLNSGEVVFPTTDRLECPHCRRAEGTKTESGEMLRVKGTLPTAHPQVFMRDYLCAKCGYTTTERYIMPRREDDYLTFEEIAEREKTSRARANLMRERRKALKENRSESE